MTGTLYQDYPQFMGLSLADIQTYSNIGSQTANWSGYSISGAHNTRRTLNPNTTSAAEVAQFVATLVADLLRPR